MTANKLKDNKLESDQKISILTASLKAVLETNEFQNEFTWQRRAETVQFFAEMFANVANETI